MRRKGLVALLGIAVAYAVAALVLGSASLKLSSTSRTASASAPACLPASLEHSASLPGAGVDVSPEPGSDTANPDTQISFLGVPAAEIHAISVVGERSGNHAGRLRGYWQGDGASFVPAAPFDAGENVRVHATVGVGVGAKAVSFSFRTDTPYPTASVPAFHNPQAAPADYQSFYTLPGAQAPLMTVTTPDRDPGAGDILTTNGPGPGQYGPLIYTPQGRLVWFQKLSGGATAEDLNEQSYEGRQVLTWWKGRVLELGFGQGEDIVMSSSYQTVARVGGGNGLQADLHDFQVAPHDVAYITAFNPIRCDLRAIKGSPRGIITDTAVQEIDIKTGLVRWEWHSLDHVGVSESEVETPADATPWDWFHINSIDAQPDGALFISARSTWAGYELQAGSGTIIWRLGGLKSSFKMGPGTETAWQHDGRILPDGEVSLFDDGSNPPIHSQSRAVRITLDFKTHRARLSADYVHRDPPLLAASQGNMQTLPNGNTLVGYGGVPAISEYSQTGALIFDAHQPYDMSFYRAYRFPWNGRPSSLPALLATRNNTAEETIVHASWNGATDVSSWRVLAGTRSGSLTAQATIPDQGFESSSTLPKRYSYLAVQALDSAGRVLGTSATVRPISFARSLTSGGAVG